MDCRQIQENLSAYLDGELPPVEAAALRRHLDGCAACRQMAEELRSVSALLKNAPRQPAPTDLADEVQRRLERDMLLTPVAEEPEIIARIDRRLAREQRPWWPRVAALAACVALVAAIAALWPTNHEKPTAVPTSGPSTDLAMTLPADQRANSWKQTSPADATKTEAEKVAEKPSGLARGFEKRSSVDRLEKKTAAVPPPAPPVPAAAPAIAQLREESARGASAENKPAAAGEQEKQNLCSAGLPESGALTSVATENRLVLDVDSDPVAAARELNQVLAQAGILNLTQQQAAPGRIMTTVAAAPAAPGAAKSARGPTAQLFETLVYTGTLNTVQLSNLNAQVAQNSNFTVARKSNGAFAQLPTTQNSFRLRKNLQGLKGQNSGGGGQSQFGATAANVRSDGWAYGFSSNAIAEQAASAPAASGVALGDEANRGGFFSEKAASSRLDKSKTETPAQVPVVIEVQTRRQQSP